MKKIILLVILIAWSCQPDKKLPADRLEGEIRGLRKGTVYLSVLKDGKPERKDSIRVHGDGKFTFDLSAYPPQVMVIELKEKPGEYILVFAGDTVNQVVTRLDKFGVNPQITGDVNTRKWLEYNNMMRQYNDKRLELIKRQWEAAKEQDSTALKQIEDEFEKLEKRRKLYGLNFAMTNASLPVGAYVALVEFYDNAKALDTLYKAMPEKVKQSVYGNRIRERLDELGKK